MSTRSLTTLAALTVLLPVAAALAAEPEPKGETVYSTDFSKPVGDEWSFTRRSVEDGQHALGPLNRVPVTLTLTDLPKHQFIRIEVQTRLESAEKPEWKGKLRIGAVAGPEVATSPYPVPQQWKSTGVFRHGEGSLTLRFSADSPLVGDERNWWLQSVRVQVLPSAVKLDKKQLEHLWQQLAAEATYRPAMNRLMLGGDSSVAFIKQKLVPDMPVDKIDALIKQLDADQWKTRQQATEDLKKYASSAATYLQKTMNSTDSAEVKSRLAVILEESEPPAASPELLSRSWVAMRILRLQRSDAAVATLEQIGDKSPYPRVRALARITVREYHNAEALSALARADAAIDSRNWDDAEKHLQQVRKLSKSHDLLMDDDILERTTRIKQIRAASELARTLEEKLKKDPSATEARQELVMLYLQRLSDPQKAAGRLGKGVDPATQMHVKLAATPEGKLTDQQLLLLTRWYNALAERTKGLGKAQLLSRAEDLARQYVSRLKKQDKVDDLARAHSLMAQIRRRRWELAGGAGDGWLNLLGDINLAIDAHGGKWRMTDKGLELQAGDFSVLEARYYPTGSYELLVQFARTENEEGIFIALPTGDSRANLNISGWGGKVSGLERIDGRQAISNPTRTDGSLANNKVHTLRAKVVVEDKNANIRVKLNDKDYITWKGATSRLRTASVWTLDHDKTFGIGAHKCSIRILRFAVRPLE
ncbi:MAG: hypothetical protein ACLFVU_11900, partial [Phycisphaerae bacterium]